MVNNINMNYRPFLLICACGNGKDWNPLLVRLIFHFEPEGPSPFPEQHSIICIQVRLKQLERAQLWPAAVNGWKFPTETLKSWPLDCCSENHLIRNQLMMVSIYSVGEPVLRFLFPVGAGGRICDYLYSHRHDCYLCLSQQSDILQCALTTGVLPLISSCIEGSLWQRMKGQG